MPSGRVGSSAAAPCRAGRPGRVVCCCGALRLQCSERITTASQALGAGSPHDTCCPCLPRLAVESLVHRAPWLDTGSRLPCPTCCCSSVGFSWGPWYDHPTLPWVRGGQGHSARVRLQHRLCSAGHVWLVKALEMGRCLSARHAGSLHARGFRPMSLYAAVGTWGTAPTVYHVRTVWKDPQLSGPAS